MSAVGEAAGSTFRVVGGGSSSSSSSTATTTTTTTTSIAAELRAERSAWERLEQRVFASLRGGEGAGTGTGAVVQLRAVVQRSSGWREARAEVLTASSFAVAAEVSPYVDAHAEWVRRVAVREASAAALDEFKVDNEHTRRGEMMEHVAVEAYVAARRAREGKRVVVSETGLWLHPVHAWLGASPDGLLEDENGLVEVKCPARSVAASVPRDHMAQIQGQLEICDRDFCDYVSFHAATRSMRVWRVQRDRAYWSWLLPRLEAFWSCVESRVPPARRSALPPSFLEPPTVVPAPVELFPWR